MSIVLLLVVLSTLLILGFGWGAWTLGFIVLMLTVGLSIIMVGVDIEEVKKNWDQRRCDLDVMTFAFLYKPDDYPGSSSQFTGDNYRFCVDQIFNEVIKTLMTPIIGLISKEMDSANVLVDMFNLLRMLKANAMNAFLSILNPVFERYKLTAMEYAVNFQKLNAAFQRISSMALSIAYLGFSMQTSIFNFVDFVIMVVLIILGIMISLIFFIWFGILPVLGLILTTIFVIADAGYNTGDTSAFCFDPKTSMKMKDGSYKSLHKCMVGDVLHDGTVIEGILETDATKESLYEIDGIIVSGSHLLWSEKESKWQHVSDFATAAPVANTLSSLICLRTSSRNIPIPGVSGTVWLFRDWEELPLRISQADGIWESIVSHILNKKGSTSRVIPKEDPLLGPKAQVRLRTGEKVYLSHIRIGDEVYSKEGFTTVLGIYEGKAALSSEFGFSDGVWILPLTSSQWIHPTITSAKEQKGYHIITASGTLWVETDSYSGYMRDFTEVGCENLFLTYGFTRALLERATRIKKSLSREESCEQDFLLLGSLSCSSPIF